MAQRKAAKPAKKKDRKKAQKPPKQKASRPKPQRLSGMEDTPKIRALDATCERLADCREILNDARKKEKELLGTALFQLQTHKIQGYKAHGVELYRVAGDEKVRVRIVDDDNTGDGSDEYMGGMMEEGSAKSPEPAQEESKDETSSAAAEA